MTNISKSKVDSQEFKEFQSQLLTTIAKLDSETTQYFFHELFTQSEKIMFIKRFGALIMFKHGYSPYKVWNTLHISPTTAQKLHIAYESGQYKNLLRSCKKSKNPILFEFVEKLIRAQGKDRWILLN